MPQPADPADWEHDAVNIAAGKTSIGQILLKRQAGCQFSMQPASVLCEHYGHSGVNSSLPKARVSAASLCDSDASASSALLARQTTDS